MASELKGKLNVDEKVTLAKSPTKNNEAYELYMKGNKCLEHGDFKGALSYHQGAVDRDPNFALSYVRMAFDYWYLRQEDMRDKMLDRAFSINPNLSEAYLLRGRILWGQLNILGQYNWDGVEREYKRAIELNPGNEEAHREYARLLRYMKRCDEALKENAIAHERNPLYMEIYGEAMAENILLEKYDDALKWFDRGKAIDPNYPYLYRQLGRLYLKQGKYYDAITAFEKQRDALASEDFKKWAILYINLAYAYSGEKGNKDKAEQYLKELLKQKGISFEWIAMMYTALGRYNFAIDWLERAYKEQKGSLIGIYSYYEYDPLRSDPRFQALIKKIGLPEEKGTRK